MDNIEAVELLLARIPEYRKDFEAHRDTLGEGQDVLPYIVFGFFAQFVMQNLEDRVVIRRVFEFMNELCDSDEPEVGNLVQVGFLEALDSKWTDIAETLLNEKGLSLLGQIQANDNRSF